MVDQLQEGMTLLDIVKAQIGEAGRYKSERMEPSLATKAQEALRASENQHRADRAQEARDAAVR